MFLQAEGISKTYRTRKGQLRVLDDVSIEVAAGESVGLIGTSGSGKTTLASILLGLETADSGTVTLQGATCPANARLSKRPAEFRRAMRDVRAVFQNPVASFSERMRVGEGIEEGVAYLGVPKAERTRRMLEALYAVGLPASYAQKYPWELSGGECQRAAFARAIISRPKLLICDEPTSSLDVTIQVHIVHLLVDLCRDLGAACLFISHDLALVRGICSRVYVLDSGRVVEQGSSDEVFERPQSDAAKLLVSSVLNL